MARNLSTVSLTQSSKEMSVERHPYSSAIRPAQIYGRNSRSSPDLHLNPSSFSALLASKVNTLPSGFSPLFPSANLSFKSGYRSRMESTMVWLVKLPLQTRYLSFLPSIEDLKWASATFRTSANCRDGRRNREIGEAYKPTSDFRTGSAAPTHSGESGLRDLLARTPVLLHQPINRATGRVERVQAVDVVQGRAKDHGRADGR